MAAWKTSDTGLAELRARWDQSPGSHLFLQLAEEYRRRGDFNEATAVLRKGISLKPSLAAQVALGRALLEGGDAEEAKGHLELAVQRDPTQMVAYRHLVEAWIQLENGQEAARCLDIYSQLNARDPDVPALAERIEGLSVRPSQAFVASPSSFATEVEPTSLLSSALDPAAEWRADPSLSMAEPTPHGVALEPTGNPESDFGSLLTSEDDETQLFFLEPTPAQEFDLFALPNRPLSCKALALPERQGRPKSFAGVDQEAPGAATATLGNLYLDQGHLDEARQIYQAVDGAHGSGPEAQSPEVPTGALNQATSMTTSGPAIPNGPSFADLEDIVSLAAVRAQAGSLGRRRVVLKAYLARITQR